MTLLGIPWEYEKEGYELPSGWYLPDFWLPNEEVWVEIKGDRPTTREKLLCEQLRTEGGNAVIIFNGLPCDGHGSCICENQKIDINCDGWRFLPPSIQWIESVVWSVEDGEPLLSSEETVYVLDNCFVDGLMMPVCSSIIVNAARKAKSARFEHGQQPKVRRLR